MNRAEIAIDFEQLLQQYQQAKSQIETKEAEIAKAYAQKLLDKTVDYTVDNIVNGMAYGSPTA